MPIIEAMLIGSTAWLAYVTQTPYHVRRRYHARIRGHVVTIWGVCRHHGRYVLWTVTAYLPRRRVKHPDSEEG